MIVHLLAAIPGHLDHLEAVLLHSLWQGFLFCLVVFMALRRTPVTRPNLRYGVAVCGLFGLVLIVLITWCALVYMDRTPPVTEVSGAAQTATVSAGLPSPVSPSPAAAVSAGRPPVLPAPRFVPAQGLLAVWFSGVLVMLLRLCWLLRGARSLSRRALPVGDPAVCALLDEMRTALRVSRRVAVRAVDGLASPVAMGLFWPVVLLPLSMLSGLTPEQLRVVLAHELAHIRRYDYLVNFLQLVIESLLYFNPAVWWLSRQTRIEREACCDALAASLSGGPEPYAVALAEVARACSWGAVLPVPAQAFGAEHRSGGLADRVRRLLQPGYWPRLRLRGHSILLGLLLSAALLLGLYQSSKLGVAFAGWCFTDAQRVEALNGVDKTLVPGPWDPNAKEEQVKVSGRVVLSDGKPMPKKGGLLDIDSFSGHHSGTSGIPTDGERFEFQTTAGEVCVSCSLPGYAPARVGPLHGDAAHPIENVEIRLEPSEPATVRFIDASGVPISGVRVTAGPRYWPNRISYTIDRVSDDSGTVTLEQSRRTPLSFALVAEASGFVKAAYDNLTLASGTSTDLVLQADTPIEGVVTDKASGNPVKGAEIALLYREAAHSSYGTDGKTLANSNEQGRFVLRGLDKGQGYYLLVKHAGHGSEVLRIAPPMEMPLTIALVPRYVRGIIQGDLSLLKRKKPDNDPEWAKRFSPQLRSLVRAGMEGLGLSGSDVPIVTSSMELHIDNLGFGAQDTETPVVIKDGVGTFQIDGLRQGELTLTAGPVSRRIQVSAPVGDLVIDLAQAAKRPTRPVRLRFTVPLGAPPASGTVIVQSNYPDGRPYENRKVQVVDGRGELTVEPPANTWVMVNGLAGYLPEPGSGKELSIDVVSRFYTITAGTDPYDVKVRLDRAGAIEGVVLLDDGAPATEVNLSASIKVEKSDGSSSSVPLNNAFNNCNSKGEFAFMPVPFGACIEVTASLGCSTQVAKLTVSEWKPVARVELKFGKLIDLPVSVLGPNGKPLPGMAVTLSDDAQYSFGMTTDTDGRCLFRGIDPSRKYTVTAKPAALYQCASIPLALDGTPNVLRLQDGLRLAGQTRFSNSDAVPANIKLRAYKTGNEPLLGGAVYQAETVTDNQGRFVFTNLCPGTFVVDFCWEGLSVAAGVEGTDAERTFTAGQTEPALIWVKPAQR